MLIILCIKNRTFVQCLGLCNIRVNKKVANMLQLKAFSSFSTFLILVYAHTQLSCIRQPHRRQILSLNKPFIQRSKKKLTSKPSLFLQENKVHEEATERKLFAMHAALLNLLQFSSYIAFIHAKIYSACAYTRTRLSINILCANYVAATSCRNQFCRDA